MNEPTISFTSTPTGRTERSEIIDSDLAGRMSMQIGTGRHAQTSIVFYTIKTCFIIGSSCSLGAYVACIYFTDKPYFIESLKGIWAIFIPVITLGLGYIFGKNKE